MLVKNELYHYGVLGMKWGVRKQQRAIVRLERKDDKWLKKHGDKLQTKVMKTSRSEMNNFVRDELKQVFKTNGKLSSATILQYNKKLATVLNQEIGNVSSPSGRVLRFVAKRGTLGVHQALADSGYDMTRVKNGVYSGGKVAYKNENLMKRGG